MRNGIMALAEQSIGFASSGMLTGQESGGNGNRVQQFCPVAISLVN